MDELMKFLADQVMLVIFIALWAYPGVLYLVHILTTKRYDSDNRFGRCMMLFLSGPFSWIVCVICGFIYLSATIFRDNKVDTAIRKYFSK